MSSSHPPARPQGPEYLEHGGGAPIDASRAARSGGRGRRGAVVGGGALLGLALAGGAVWAAASFFGTGSQPAEALPDSTLGYVSVDLDPAGAQKIEAIRTLRQFPAFREHVGLQADDDVRRKIFEWVQQGAPCEGLDYDDHVAPWLGARAAVAAVDAGDDQPSPVAVVQVTDPDAAADGLDRLRACAEGAGGGGWAIEGDWAVIAASDAVAERVVDAAAEAPLSDDADFAAWTDRVGDPGIVSLYAAPAAGAYLADRLGDLAAFGPAMSMSPGAATGDDAARALEDFGGGAAAVRFHSGAVELEVAADSGATSSGAFAGDRGDDVLATLPADTAAALGIGFSRGWFTQLAEQLSSATGGRPGADRLLAMLSRQSGLDLPADAETLAGKSLALALGGDVDLDRLVNSSDGSDVPVAAKVQGDPAAIEAVLDKVRSRMGGGTTPLDSDAVGDVVAVGPNAQFRRVVLEDGALGDSAAFTDVVPRASEAGAVLFVNFDAGDDWLAELAAGDRQAAENIAPLAALGISARQEGDTGRALVRLTTD